MKTIAAFSILLIFFGIPKTSSARIVKNWTPDEIFEKASFICNGLALENTVIKPNASGYGRSVARIKVLCVFKGDTADIIQLKYNTMPPETEMDTPHFFP